MTTRLFLVTFLSRKTPFFDDETTSRQLFWAKNTIFWRRDSFSSPLWGKKLTFLATRLFLVVTFGRETPLFGDETPFSSSLLHGKLHFLATKLFLVVTFARETPLFSDETSSRHLFEPENAHFWRRDLFSSSFWGKNSLFWRRDSFSSSLLLGKLHFLATRPLLVVILG
ncbi:hypothetical protein NSS91_19460 [Caldifermentibacillus hisashii]|uniref:hypothetical protein n=1 Tax=Caldifermentibacillus hisashii TaxID=996558 RepID=UPI0031FCA929